MKVYPENNEITSNKIRSGYFKKNKILEIIYEL